MSGISKNISQTVAGGQMTRCGPPAEGRSYETENQAVSSRYLTEEGHDILLIQLFPFHHTALSYYPPVSIETAAR
jgi:hypothetical protein